MTHLPFPPSEREPLTVREELIAFLLDQKRRRDAGCAIYVRTYSLEEVLVLIETDDEENPLARTSGGTNAEKAAKV